MNNMTMPIDLVLVRHGESEGNAAKRRLERGEVGLYDEVLGGRHTRSYRLTDKGQAQATQAGHFIRTHMGHFDRCIVSEYARAVETAGLLDIEGAHWYKDFYLTERDWGDLDNCTEEARATKFVEALAMRDVEPFFWRPPNGEHMGALSLRLNRILHTLHRECSDKRVIMVCHGEVMWAFRVMLERMPQERYRELHQSKDSADRINNCQLLHYTRRDPFTNRLARHANWMRSIRPTSDPVELGEWTTITRPVYSNQELLESLEHYPRILA
jgi:NAD+ kinase